MRNAAGWLARAIFSVGPIATAEIILVDDGSTDATAPMLAENVIGTSTVMARTDLLRAAGGFDGGMPQSEDWDLWLRLAACAPVGCLPAVLTDYTMHRPGNLSGQRRARLDAMHFVVKRHGAMAGRLDPSALKACRVRLMVAAAEATEAEGARLWASLLHLGAWLRRPARRHFREAAAALLG